MTGCVYLIAADGEQDVLAWDLEAGAHLGLKVSLVAILPEAGHLARAGHLHAQQDIGSCQPRI